MKKLLSLIFLIVAGLSANAQNPSFSPSIFNAEDQVTLTIDVTGTNMAGATEAYIWIFSNPDIGGGADGVSNGSWTNSSNDAKMTAAGTNKWSFTFIGTTLFGQSPAQLKSFGFLVKKKDGSAQTPDYKPYFFDPLVFTPTVLRVFPAKVGVDDVVTLNFSQAYGITVYDQRMTPIRVGVTMLDDLNNQVGSLLEIPVVKTGNAIWSGSFIPSRSFTPAAGRKLAKFNYEFQGTVLDPGGAPIIVPSSSAQVIFTTMQ